MSDKIRVGLLGATGAIGEYYARLLRDHPWFTLTSAAASGKSRGVRIDDVIVRSLDDMLSDPQCNWIFSALPNSLARRYDPSFAEIGMPVISSASCHRSDPDIPVVIPEVNGHTLKQLPQTGGCIVAKPNCSIQSFLLPLAPLHKHFRIKRLFVTTLQALSGAGKHAPQLKGNVLPYIVQEEEKLEHEPLKILGDPTIKISAHCTRVPVPDGHMACVSVEFAREPTREQILEIWSQPSDLRLPSAPLYPIRYREESDRPQPELDLKDPMVVVVGRLRHCPLLQWRFCALSHNRMRGGAGGGVLIAESLLQAFREHIKAECETAAGNIQ